MPAPAWIKAGRLIRTLSLENTFLDILSVFPRWEDPDQDDVFGTTIVKDMSLWSGGQVLKFSGQLLSTQNTWELGGRFKFGGQVPDSIQVVGVDRDQEILQGFLRDWLVWLLKRIPRPGGFLRLEEL